MASSCIHPHVNARWPVAFVCRRRIVHQINWHIIVVCAVTVALASNVVTKVCIQGFCALDHPPPLQNSLTRTKMVSFRDIANKNGNEWKLNAVNAIRLRMAVFLIGKSIWIRLTPTLLPVSPLNSSLFYLYSDPKRVSMQIFRWRMRCT